MYLLDTHAIIWYVIGSTELSATVRNHWITEAIDWHFEYKWIHLKQRYKIVRTITVRIDDSTYDIFKLAADGQKRTISNYLEYATLNYTMNETIVDDIEMNEILKSEEDIKKGLSDISAGRYRIID